MKSLNTLVVLAMAWGAAPVLAQTPTPPAPPAPGYPRRIGGLRPAAKMGPPAWCGPRTRIPKRRTPPNKPIWHIAGSSSRIRVRRAGNRKVLLTRDFDGRYVQMAPGDKSKCMFWADDRAWGWVYGGQVKVTIDGQEPKVLPKGWGVKWPPRLSYCLETAAASRSCISSLRRRGKYHLIRRMRPRRRLRATHTRRSRSIRPAVTTRSTCHSSMSMIMGASTRTGERFLYDGHTSSNLNIGPPLTQLPPSNSWGHFHENMPEIWLNVWGNVCALISGEGVVQGEYGDLINANEERWHRATSCPNTGRSIRMAITPRSKEGQVHYFQIDAAGEK